MSIVLSINIALLIEQVPIYTMWLDQQSQFKKGAKNTDCPRSCLVDYEMPGIPPSFIKADAFSLGIESHRNNNNGMTSPVYNLPHYLFLLVLTIPCQDKYLGNILRTSILQMTKICSEGYSDSSKDKHQTMWQGQENWPRSSDTKPSAHSINAHHQY